VTELIRGWVLGLTAASFITAIAMTIAPKGRTRAATALVSGLVTIVVLIAPILDFDHTVPMQDFTESEVSFTLAAEEMQNVSKSLQARIISERSMAYILDKAESVGLPNLDIRIQTKAGADGFVVPYAIYLTGDYTIEQRRTLEAYLVGTFGIPIQRQTWSVTDA